MHTKLIKPGSWIKLAEAPVQIIKLGRRGLVGSDRAAFIKRASHALADQIDRLKVRDDEIPIHVIAMCSTEGWGPNRNMDGWKEAMLRRQHPTFVKNGRHYEYHINKDPARSYGDVRLSTYNEPMRRVELMVIGNKTKEAAQRNGGLVLPDHVADSIERGDATPFSMASKLAFDSCINCGNKAPSREHYCTESTCINPDTGYRGFGCKHGLGKMASDGFLQYVDNPDEADPTFFDISRVGNPAERSAYGWKADYLTKAAATNRVIGGAELAEQYGFSLLDHEETAQHDRYAREREVAHKLAAIEHDLLTNGPTPADMARAYAFTADVQPEPTFSCLGPAGSVRFSNGLSVLAQNKIAFSFRTFVRMLHEDSAALQKQAAVVSATAAPAIIGVFSRLASDPTSLEQQFRDNILFRPASNAIPSGSQQLWAQKVASSHGLSAETLRHRVQQASLFALRSPMVLRGDSLMKYAAAAEPAHLDLARQYALYVVSTVASMPNDTDDLTLRAAVLQNLIN